MELGAIIPISIFIVFTIGMIVGDISWAIQTDYFSSAEFVNPFVVSR